MNIPLIESLWHVVSSLLIFLMGAALCAVVGGRFGIRRKRSLFIYAWHTIFCFLYIQYVLAYGGDAVGYYRHAWTDGLEIYFGTAAIKILTSWLVAELGLSFLGASLVFNVVGTIGLLAFDAALRVATWNKGQATRRLASLLVFLPSASFWSSAIGKDALSFTAATLSLWAAINLRKRIGLMAAAIGLMLVVRPHVAALMILAVAISAVTDDRVTFLGRLVIGAAAAVGAAIMVPLALNYAGIGEDASAERLVEYIGARQEANLEGGSSIDISSMSFGGKLVTYLFRPLIFEANSVTTLAAATDNLVLMFLVLAWMGNLLRRRRVVRVANHAYLWSYAAMAWIILALTTANLGIAVRQKWMFMPMLIFLFISLIGRSREIGASLTPVRVVDEKRLRR